MTADDYRAHLVAGAEAAVAGIDAKLAKLAAHRDAALEARTVAVVHLEHVATAELNFVEPTSHAVVSPQ